MEKEIKDYIVQASLLENDKINEETLIFEEGVLDSMGLLFLIEFLKETYNLEVDDEELNPVNFKSINSITKFVKNKMQNADPV